ncbi:MAG: hypothetical protein AOA66_0596 [Candidatus Bathyarchaeota archaeon BA2]|nr:MAG: hypothetical protein AOA66_0596 [Candidatus Bathyarchaeota archaeon BA2]
MPVGFNRELCKKEHNTLRIELNNLKNCQVTFLTFSVAATGVLLGLIKIFSSSNYEIFFLAPLTILLPAWSVFLDKAKTISRIVGYYRIIEGLILDKISVNKFVGWENALQIFRDNEPIEMYIKKEAIKKLREKPRFENNQTSFGRLKAFSPFRDYLTLVNCIFLCLSVLCMMPAIIFALVNVKSLNANHFIIALVSIIFISTFVHNSITLRDLLCGKHAYEVNEHFWRYILEVETHEDEIESS